MTGNGGRGGSRRWLAGLGLVVLLLLHLDPWRPEGWPGAVAGVPGELVYRLAWMGLAFGYLAWVLAAREGESR